MVLDRLDNQAPTPQRPSIGSVHSVQPQAYIPRTDVTTRKVTHSSAAATAPERQSHRWRAGRSAGGLPGGARRRSVLRRGLHLRWAADRPPGGTTRERRPAVSRPRRRPRRPPSTTTNSLPPRTRTRTPPASVARAAALAAVRPRTVIETPARTVNSPRSIPPSGPSGGVGPNRALPYITALLARRDVNHCRSAPSASV
jgi:hypothetical protein